jgi:hypothetical protein
MAEQDETENEEDRQRFADRVLSFAEDAVYWAIAVVLLVGSVALLVAQVNTIFRSWATAPRARSCSKSSTGCC